MSPSAVLLTHFLPESGGFLSVHCFLSPDKLSTINPFCFSGGENLSMNNLNFLPLSFPVFVPLYFIIIKLFPVIKLFPLYLVLSLKEIELYKSEENEETYEVWIQMKVTL